MAVLQVWATWASRSGPHHPTGTDSPRHAGKFVCICAAGGAGCAGWARLNRPRRCRRAINCSNKAGPGRLEAHRAGLQKAFSGGNALELYDDNGNSRITCAEAREHGIAPVQREDVRSPLETWQVCHRDPGKALAIIKGHQRRSNNDFLDSFLQESFLLPCKLFVSTCSFPCILPAFC